MHFLYIAYVERMSSKQGSLARGSYDYFFPSYLWYNIYLRFALISEYVCG